MRGHLDRSEREQERRTGGKTGREIDLITRLPVSLDVFRGDRMQPRVDSRRGGERGSSWRRFLDPGPRLRPTKTLPKTRDSICRLQIKTAARRGPQKWA